MALEGSGKSVLVVDDDAFVRKIVERQFYDLGTRVTTVGDGDSALRQMRQSRFDIVVCDLKLPDVDGIELLRDFAELQPSASLVLMSSVDAKTLEAAEQLARARDLRLLGSLQKPFVAGAFMVLLERHGEAVIARKPQAPSVIVTPEALRAAIAAREIDVYVQPKLDLSSGRLVGAEALARWLRADGTIVMPDAFLEVAERSGQMAALTDLVLGQAFAACACWRGLGLDTSIAVNIPVSCLSRLDLPDRISAEAARHGLKPEQVILEVTETGALSDLTLLLDVVTRLRLRGFHLAVDDFGIGYSSLERLRHLPFTELKLDRAFVDGAARDPELRSIVESTIRLAHDLRLSTCAEGVESPADLDVMRALGCEVVQGFFLSRPMPKGDLPAWACAHAPASTAGPGSDPRSDGGKGG